MKGELNGLIDKATFGRFDKEVIQKLRAKRLKGAVSATKQGEGEPDNDEAGDDTEMLKQLLDEQVDDSGTENTQGKKKERAK